MVRFCGVLTQMRSAFLTAPIDWNQVNLVLVISLSLTKVMPIYSLKQLKSSICCGKITKKHFTI